jgi:hypothetical protein
MRGCAGRIVRERQRQPRGELCLAHPVVVVVVVVNATGERRERERVFGVFGVFGRCRKK